MSNDLKPTLVIYIAADGEGYLELSGGLLANDRCTRILGESFDYQVSPKSPEIGYRLTESKTFMSKGQRIAHEIPTDWVVTSVESYAPNLDNPCFRGLILASCERQPLSLEDFKDWVSDEEVVSYAEPELIAG